MNYQNIPRSDKVIKQAFVPKLDAFLYFDYKNIEPRILAYYLATLGDSEMAQVFLDERDLYSETSMAVLNLQRQPTDEERQIGKVLILSLLYGGGAPTLMRQLGVTYQEAREYQHNFHQAWPGVKMLQNVIDIRLQERGYITTLFGRHLHPESEHKALNALIQGCAADLMKAALVKVDHFLQKCRYESHMVSVIHDEIIIDAIDDELGALSYWVPHNMRDERVDEVVPILVDVEISRSTWAEKEAYDKEAYDS